MLKNTKRKHALIVDNKKTWIKKNIKKYTRQTYNCRKYNILFQSI